MLACPYMFFIGKHFLEYNCLKFLFVKNKIEKRGYINSYYRFNELKHVYSLMGFEFWKYFLVFRLRNQRCFCNRLCSSGFSKNHVFGRLLEGGMGGRKTLKYLPSSFSFMPRFLSFSKPASPTDPEKSKARLLYYNNPLRQYQLFVALPNPEDPLMLRSSFPFQFPRANNQTKWFTYAFFTHSFRKLNNIAMSFIWLLINLFVHKFFLGKLVETQRTQLRWYFIFHYTLT